MRPVAAAALLPIILVCGCGTEVADPDRSPATGGGWQSQTLRAEPGADSPVGIATAGDDALVVVVSEDGVLQPYLSTDGGEFVVGEPIDTASGGYPGFADPVRLDGTWWVLGSGGAAHREGEELLFEPEALLSADGLHWEPAAIAGIDAPVEVHALSAVDGALVAVGVHRNAADPSGLGGTAGAWRSDDGTNWTELDLPGVVGEPSYEQESWAGSLVVTGDRLLAGGQLAGHGAVWSSDDAGASWRRVTDPRLDELYTVSGLAAQGSTVVVSGTPRGDDGGSRLLRSVDAGRTWSSPSNPPPPEGEGWTPAWSGGGRFFTLAEPGFTMFDDPALCYADLDQCRETGSAPLIYTSEDGAAWSPVDTSGAADALEQLVGVSGTESGRVLLATVVREGVAVHTWPADVDLPAGTEPDQPRTVELLTVPQDGEPDVGVRYHAPLYVHCGMDRLYLGSSVWRRTDSGPDVETGAGDPLPYGWPIAGETIYGYATLTEDGILEYAIGDDPAAADVIASYRRAEEGAGCD